MSDRCGLCNGRQTSIHVLSACPVGLNQKRFTWRHDGTVTHIASCVDTEKFTMFADIPGHQTNAGGTIPPEILVTNSRPDLVIIDKKQKTLNVFELTVPYEHNEKVRHTEKQNRYASMETDIVRIKANIVAFEIGARGYISKENRTRIKSIYSYCKKNVTLKKFEENISKLSIYASYYIYLCRNQSEWASPPLLTID